MEDLDLERCESDPRGEVRPVGQPPILTMIRAHRIQVKGDAVFGNEEGAQVQYVSMEWWHAGLRASPTHTSVSRITSDIPTVMLAETVSLGVLALPQAVAVLGLVPGLFLILILGVIVTYTGYVIGQFKQAFPEMQSFADCGELIAGPIGREIMAASQVLILVFIMAAHILSFAIALNVLTDHSRCTLVFSVAGLLICFILGLPRTLKAVSFLSIFCRCFTVSSKRRCH